LGDIHVISVSPTALDRGGSLASPFGSSAMYRYEFWCYPNN